MTSSTIALIIIAIIFVMYITELFSVATTTMIGMLAFVFTGILSYEEAFSCFASTPVMLTLGVIMIANSLVDNGIGSSIGKLMVHVERRSEKALALIILLTTAFISIFTNNSAIVATYMPLLASISIMTHGHITKKNTYMPLAVGSLLGGTGSLAGGTAPLLANEVLAYSGAEQFSFFTTLPVALCVIGVISVCFWLFLYKLQLKWFDFEEKNNIGSSDIHEIPLNKKNILISVFIFLTCIVLFIFRPFEWDLGFIAISGVVILVATKCLDGKQALATTPWSAIVTLGAALAMAKGFVASGAGHTIITWLMNTLGDSVLNPVVMVTIFLIAGFILSQFMSNGSLVSMLCAIAIPMAIEVGIDPKPVALACVFGSSFAMATPVATTTVTMVQVAGYRFKDYFRFGSTVGIICVITAWISIVFIYGLF